MNRLTVSTFQPCLNEAFRINAGAAGVFELVLSEVTPLPPQPRAPRTDPFTLLFLGPLSPILPQSIYVMENARLGTLKIFIVPIGPNKQGRMQYQAVFN